jgi:hypothetical protein
MAYKMGEVINTYEEITGKTESILGISHRTGQYNTGD